MEKYIEFDINRADISRSMVIEASAGTGKTYSLERLVLRYIAEKGFETGEILVVTFTEKAALELKTRIRSLLKKSVSSPPPGYGETEMERLGAAFSGFAESQIFTIHGFCNYCIQNFPFECGVRFRTSIMKSTDIYREAVLDYLRTAENSELDECYMSFRGEWKDLESAVGYLAGLLADNVFSGADQVIPDRETVERLVRFQGEFRNRTGVFYEAVAELGKCKKDPETLERISSKMKLRFQKKTLFLLSSILEEISASGSLSDFYSDNLDKEAQRLRKFSSGRMKLRGDLSLLDSEEKALADSVEKIFDAASIFQDKSVVDGKYFYHRAASFAFSEKALEKISLIAERKKTLLSSLDFNDLIKIIAGAVEGKDGQSLLAQELGRKYRVVLIDEFQDTDSLQWKIFSRVFRNDAHTIVLIGDPKQSIYRFRGADLEVYFRAVESLENAVLYRLGTCYRSTESLTGAVNDMFHHVFSRTSGGGHEITCSPVKSAPDADEKAHVSGIDSCVEILGIENSNDEKSKESVNRLIQAAYADEIANLTGKGIAPSEICVLCEVNNDCISMLDLLRNRNIPSIYEGDVDLFASAETAMFIDLLFALSTPGDLSCVKKVLFSDFFNIGSGVIADMESRGLTEAVVMKFTGWSEKAAAGRIHEVFDEIFYGEDIFPFSREEIPPDRAAPYLARKLSETGGERKAVNSMHLAEVIVSRNMMEKETAPALLRYLLSVAAGFEQPEERNVRLDREPDCVRIMTIHNSKGLEFPVVFFLGGLSGSNPSRVKREWYEYLDRGKRVLDFTLLEENRDRQFEEQWEEKKRLYYVAMTRAAVKLYLPAARYLPDGNLAGFYSSVVYDSLSSILEGQGISLGFPVNIDKKSLPGDMKVSDGKEILSRSIFALLNEYCSGKSFMKFRSIVPGEDEALFPSMAAVSPSGKEFEKTQNLRARSPEYDRREASGGRALYSYSSLSSSASRSSHSAGQDTEIRHIEEKEDDEESNGETVELEGLERIKGSDFGNIMHKALETADYSAVTAHESEDSLVSDPYYLDFAESCARNFVPSEAAGRCRETVLRLLYRTLATEIETDEGVVRIGDIPENERRHELEFMIRLEKGTSAVRELPDGIGQDGGFLKGFIDMVFRHGSSYYIIDWKTNNLGKNLENYAGESLTQAMEMNNYILQMNIYMGALRQIAESEKETSASNRAAAGSRENPRVGGCFYLFLRGLTGKQGDRTGVFFSPPDRGKEALPDTTFVRDGGVN